MNPMLVRRDGWAEHALMEKHSVFATSMKKQITMAAAPTGALLIATILMAGVAAADNKPSSSTTSAGKSSTSNAKSSSSSTTSSTSNAKQLTPTFESKVPVVVHVTFTKPDKPKKLTDINNLGDGYQRPVDPVDEGTEIKWEATPLAGDRAPIKGCSGKKTIHQNDTAIVMRDGDCEKRDVRAEKQGPQPARPGSQNVEVSFVNMSDVMKVSFSNVQDKLLGTKIGDFTLDPKGSHPITVAKDPSCRINISVRIDCEGAGGAKLAKAHEEAYWDDLHSTITVIDGCHFKLP